MYGYRNPASALKLPRRFWSKVDKSGDCWLWTAYKDRDGYGTFQVPVGPRKAHRVAYELTVGPIPPNMTLDHLCANPGCVNPDHLEPVSVSENVKRSRWATMKREATHCKNGHPFVGHNLLRRDGGRRGCRECGNEAQRRYQARKRSATGF